MRTTKISELFSTILKKSLTDNEDDDAEKNDKKEYDLLENRKKWKILADLWINSSGSTKIHIGR